MKLGYCKTRSAVEVAACNYYGENFHSLKKHADVRFLRSVTRSSDALKQHPDLDALILGFSYSDTGESSPPAFSNDCNLPLFIILNKEYAALENKLDWIKKSNPKAFLTVHHDYEKYAEATGIPCHRIMWSTSSSMFKDYKDPYSSDLYFSGVVRPEQTNDWRTQVYENLHQIQGYKLNINTRLKSTGYQGQVFSPEAYARHLASSKICFTTTGPADLVGTRYFEIMAGNRALILCNRMENPLVYDEMLTEGFNCAMFSTLEEFIDKFKYYIEHEDQRMKIVNQAYDHFISSQTWTHRSEKTLSIIEKYIS